MRSVFYHGLDDPYIQKEVSNIKEADQSLKSFLVEAIAAEGRAVHYKETINRSHALENASLLTTSLSSAPTVSRFDSSTAGNTNKRGKGRGKHSYENANQSSSSSVPKAHSNNFSHHQSSNKQYNSKHSNSNQHQSSNFKKNNGNNSNGAKPKITCYYCKKVGHKEEDCRKKARDLAATSSNTASVVFPKLEGKLNESTVQNNAYLFKKVEISGSAACNKASPMKESGESTVEVEKSAYLEELLVKVDELVNLYMKLEPYEAAMVESLVEGALSLANTATDLHKGKFLSLDELKGVCKDVEIVCELLRPDLSSISELTEVSAQPTATVLSKEKCAINALPPSVPDIFQPIITAAMIVEEKYICEFEIDTDASHTVVSPEVYQKAYLVARDKPEKGPKTPMKLADGSHSQKTSFRTYLSLARADNPKNVKTFEVMVLEGPSVILGRTAIKYFWPKIYNDLLAAAGSTHKAASLIPAHPKEVLDSMLASVQVKSESTAIVASTVTDDEATDTPSTEVTDDYTQEEGERKCLQIASEFPTLFDGKLGKFKGVKAKIHLKEGHEKYLKVMPPAKVPYGIEPEFNIKLKELMETHIPVDGIKLKCASQLVPVMRHRDKSKLRLCVNYKSTLNDHIEDEPYMFPTCNEQLGKLRGEMYTVLDCKGAFGQIEVDTEAGELLTIATPEGYAQPTRLPFGIKTAPKIFQSNMDKLIHGMDGKSPIPNTACIVDDICVTGLTPQDHFNNLRELLSRLDSSGLKLNAEKCKFYQHEVKFLGKIIDKNGQRVDPNTVAAIVNMPSPKDKNTLRSFLGHMSYVGKHISNLRTARAPLDVLLKEDVKFVWKDEQRQAFEKCKKMASSTNTLAHYDDKLPLVLTTDASPVGLGACLSHKVEENGKVVLKPLHYASCSLKASEKNYAQVDREGLAVFWATKYFRQFLQCRSFELHTDCSALKRIFGPKNDLGGCASSRLNRWAAALSGFDFQVIHIKGTSNRVCDSLSRLPSPATDSYECSTMSVCSYAACLAELPLESDTPVSISSILGSPTMDPWNVLPVTVKDVAKATRDDRVYGKLLNAVRTGNANLKDVDLKPFVSMINDFHIEQDVLFYGARIIVPTVLQTRLLEELHETHMGSVKMKETSRKYFWWPKISSHIDNIVKNCLGCAKYKRKPTDNISCPWPFARQPMERVHIDYCDYKGKQILVMIDSYTKYIWAKNMNANTTSSNTLVTLFEWFGECSGFPKTLVSDNGTQFTSQEFADHMKIWGIKHLFSPPYHPASNGLAEKAVHIIKDKLKKMEAPVQPLHLKAYIADVLRVYRGTVHSSTCETPYDLMKTAVSPSLFPQLQVKHRDIVGPDRKRAKSFEVGNHVLVYDKLTKTNSLGIIKEIKSKNSYIVDINGVLKHVSGDDMSHTVITDDSEPINDKILRSGRHY